MVSARSGPTGPNWTLMMEEGNFSKGEIFSVVGIATRIVTGRNVRGPKPGELKISLPVQICPETVPVSCIMGTDFFPGGKAAGSRQRPFNSI